jgi:hypothetical protein
MTFSSRLLASFRTGHKIIGGKFRLAVYGKILQGEAELLEQHDRERCVSVGAFYQLADGISRETGMPLEEVDKLIQNMTAAVDPGNPDSVKGALQSFGLLSTDQGRLHNFLASQTLLGDQKKAQVHRVLIGRGEGMDPESLEWVKLGPNVWSEEDTAQLPTDLINEIQQFLLEEKAAMLAAGKPPAPAKKPRRAPRSSAAASTATA